MKKEDSPFPSRWCGIGITNYRESSYTYEHYDYDTIPPIDDSSFDGTFSWLYESELRPESNCGVEFETEFQQRWKEIHRQSISLGMSLPREFVTFMSDRDLYSRVPSMTGSYWRLPDFIAQCPDAPGSMIMFRSESQDCLFWYLYLNERATDHCVVVSWDYFGFRRESEREFPEEPNRIFFCSPSFEVFVYREAMEHGADWNIFSANPLTHRQQKYVDHYRPPNDQSDRRRRCEVHDCFLQPGKELWLRPTREVFPTGSHAFHRDARQMFPNASAVCACSWMLDTQEILAPRAYCPECREELVQYCQSKQFELLLQLLRDRIGIT